MNNLNQQLIQHQSNLLIDEAAKLEDLIQPWIDRVKRGLSNSDKQYWGSSIPNESILYSLEDAGQFYTKHQNVITSILMYYGPGDVISRSLMDLYCSTVFLLIKAHLEFLIDPYPYGADIDTTEFSMFFHLRPIEESLNGIPLQIYKMRMYPSIQESVRITDYYVFNLLYVFSELYSLYSLEVGYNNLLNLKLDYDKTRNVLSNQVHLPSYSQVKLQLEAEILQRKQNATSIKTVLFNKVKRFFK